MKFTPRTEDQVQAANGFILCPGPCEFEVTKADEQTSSAGNPMIKLTMQAWDQKGKQATVFDYLLEAMAHKVRHFAYAVGLGEQYESGRLEAEDCVGRSGKLLIRTKPARDGYDAKNDVQDYVVEEGAKSADGYQQAKARDNGTTKPTNKVRAWQKFCARIGTMDTESRAKAWKEALTQVYGDADISSLTDEQWHQMYIAASRYDAVNGVPLPLRKREEVVSPIGDTPVFNDEDIPF